MWLRLEARSEPSKKMTYLSPVVAVILTLFSGMIIFAFMGKSPIEGIYVFFIEPITSLYSLGELAVKATPLILIALGLAVGFKANIWNIGAEGQLVMGAIFGGGIALWFYQSDSAWLLPMMLVFGAIGGMFWAAIPALLKTKFKTNEILSSLMLTYVAILFLNFMVNGPYRDPSGYNFPESRLFQDAALLPILMEGTRFNLGSLITIMLLVGLWVMLARTIIGFQVKVVGQAPDAAKYAGFNHKKIIWFAFLLGGAMAGLAGIMEVSGPIGQLLPSISPGYGFTAIIVAFLGRLHPIGILFAGLIMAISYLGGESAQISLGLPVALTGLFQGLLLFYLLAADVLIMYRVRFSFNKHTLSKEGA